MRTCRFFFGREGVPKMLLICSRLAEALPAAAGAFSRQKKVSETLWYVLGLVRSSWLPQARFCFWQEWRSRRLWHVLGLVRSPRLPKALFNSDKNDVPGSLCMTCILAATPKTMQTIVIDYTVPCCTRVHQWKFQLFCFWFPYPSLKVVQLIFDWFIWLIFTFCSTTHCDNSHKLSFSSPHQFAKDQDYFYWSWRNAWETFCPI